MVYKDTQADITFVLEYLCPSSQTSILTAVTFIWIALPLQVSAWAIGRLFSRENVDGTKNRVVRQTKNAFFPINGRFFTSTVVLDENAEQ